MKYRNQRTECYSGHKHASKLESDYCDQLRLLVKAKGIKAYFIQHKYPLEVNGIHICNHIVDFVVLNNKSETEVHETKGFVTRDWKIKRKLFEACYPLVKYIVIGGQKTWETRRKRTSSR